MEPSSEENFKASLCLGVPEVRPSPAVWDNSVSHAPRRKDILLGHEKQLALRNALRYFKSEFHPELAPEFAEELRNYGRIYMYRFRPQYEMRARPIWEYPGRYINSDTC